MTILGRSEELVSRCVECDLAEPESLASLGGSAPGVVDGILSPLEDIRFKLKINKDQAEEIMSYNKLMDYIQKGADAEEDPDSLF